MALAKTSKPCFALADLEKGRVIVLIDSLDELPTDSARSRVLEIVESSLARYELTKVILTSRPIRFATQLADAGTYLEYWINPISWKQAEKILKIVRKGDGLTHHQSQEMLRKLERLHGIELNPLLVTVFAATSDYAKQDIPANITELFKKFTELMLGRWDEQKDYTSSTKRRSKTLCCSGLATKCTLIGRHQSLAQKPSRSCSRSFNHGATVVMLKHCYLKSWIGRECFACMKIRLNFDIYCCRSFLLVAALEAPLSLCMSLTNGGSAPWSFILASIQSR